MFAKWSLQVEKRGPAAYRAVVERTRSSHLNGRGALGATGSTIAFVAIW
jgi:hypothetical protein